MEKLSTNGWDAGIKIISRIEVIIPVKLLLVCNQIASRLNDNEFSIVTDIKEKAPAKLILGDEFYIPKQSVGRTSIDYLPDTYSHNVCIHRHPDSLNNFSGTDREYINQNFELSILYTQHEGFVFGVFNHKIDESCIIQLPIEIEVDYNLEPVDISNIQELSDLKFPENIFDDKKVKDIKLEKFNGKDKKMHEDDQILDLENRIFCLEEAVYYSNHFENGHY